MMEGRRRDRSYSFVGSVVLFIIGFLTVLAAFRLIFGNFPRNIPKYTIWLASTAAGLANVALFFLLINLQLK